jgi:hypothetical protein
MQTTLVHRVLSVDTGFPPGSDPTLSPLELSLSHRLRCGISASLEEVALVQLDFLC